MISTALPKLPELVSECQLPKCQLPEYQLPKWQRVCTNLFKFQGHSYLLVVDYYSLFIEVAQLDHTTSEEIILQTKKIFVRFEMLEVVVSDNRPQYSSEAYATFARTCD